MTKTDTKPRSAKKAAAPILDKALSSSSMSPATEDLLTGVRVSAEGPSELQYLALDVVFPATDNPRSNLGDLTGLAASIAAVGVLEPILVQRGVQHGYWIVAGHRRHAAAAIAGLELIPCLVRTFTAQARIEAMVIENLQRQDLSPFDEARGLTQLVGVGLSQRDIAERVGCSQSHVSKRLSLAELPPAAEKMFVEERLAIRHVEELAKVPADAIGAVVDRLVDRVGKLREATLLPDWAIDQEIKDLKTTRKHAEAEKEGAASGLKRITGNQYITKHYGSHRSCTKKEATHWYLGERDTSVVWARTEAAHKKANPPKPEPAQPLSSWQLREAANERIDEFIGDEIFPKVAATPETRFVFIAQVTKLVYESLTIDNMATSISVFSLEAEFAEAIGDDRGLYVALAQLCGLAGAVWNLEVLKMFTLDFGYRTTGIGETFPEGYDPTPILITATEATEAS